MKSNLVAFEFQELHLSEESKLSKCKVELEKVKEVEAESIKLLEDLKALYEKRKEEAHELGAKAMDVVDKEKHFPDLQALKNLYYLITRIHWGQVSSNGNAVRGFVINAAKNDVSTFKLDRRDSHFATSILWDYIGASVSSNFSE